MRSVFMFRSAKCSARQTSSSAETRIVSLHVHANYPNETLGNRIMQNNRQSVLGDKDNHVYVCGGMEQCCIGGRPSSCLILRTHAVAAAAWECYGNLKMMFIDMALFCNALLTTENFLGDSMCRSY